MSGWHAITQEIASDAAAEVSKMLRGRQDVVVFELELIGPFECVCAVWMVDPAGSDGALSAQQQILTTLPGQPVPFQGTVRVVATLLGSRRVVFSRAVRVER